jgi:hypothetical protein
MTSPSPEPDGVEQLARVADRLAARGLTPRRFLRALAWNVARIRPDAFGALDLARGGANRVRGKGFRREYDDGSTGQPRHFAGVAVAPLFLGDGAARWAARHVLRDVEGSPDHDLSLAALEFSRELRDGTLPVAEAGAWIRSRLAD